RLIFSSSMSAQMTSLPVSARQAPPTSPTRPGPITATRMGRPSRSSLWSRTTRTARARARSARRGAAPPAPPADASPPGAARARQTPGAGLKHSGLAPAVIAANGFHHPTPLLGSQLGEDGKAQHLSRRPLALHQVTGPV